MKVRELMSRDVATCTPQTSLAEAAVLMLENDCGALPVIGEGKRVLSMITDRDIAIAVGTRPQGAAEIPVATVLSGPATAVDADDDLADALRTMKQIRVHRLPVVGAEGELIGLLSMNDLILHAERTPHARASGLPAYDDVVAALKVIGTHWSALAESNVAAAERGRSRKPGQRAGVDAFELVE